MNKKYSQKKLIEKQNMIRQYILRIAMQDLSSGAHLGGALSSVEIISIIFDSFLTDKDKFILSKGHASLALYATLYAEKILNLDDIQTYHKSGSFLLGHPVKRKNKGIQFSTGSLGMGLSLSSGLAFLNKYLQNTNLIFCLIGDGELDEGSNWEAFKFASQYKLDNLICLIDCNGFQQTGSKVEISKLYSLKGILYNLGWEVYQVDGHSNQELFQSISNAIQNNSGKPSVIICDTIKGKGINVMENNNDYHHKLISKIMYEEFLDELSLGFKKYEL